MDKAIEPCPERLMRICGDQDTCQRCRASSQRHTVVCELLVHEKEVRDHGPLVGGSIAMGQLNSKAIRLPDNPRLVNQIAALECCTALGGRDSIVHPPGAHDDL